MCTEIRQEWDGIVWRLFPTFEAAQYNADILNRHNSQEFIPVLHDSKNGYYIECKKFGEVFDVAGKVK